MNNLISHPLTYGKWPISQVLNDLASQENCDGEPYDQMILAAEYIKFLEEKIAALQTPHPEPIGVLSASDGDLLKLKSGRCVSIWPVSDAEEGDTPLYLTPPASVLKRLNKDQIREVFLRNGFTVKEGQSDLKEYVYNAAYEMLLLAGGTVEEQKDE